MENSGLKREIWETMGDESDDFVVFNDANEGEFGANMKSLTYSPSNQVQHINCSLPVILGDNRYSCEMEKCSKSL